MAPIEVVPRPSACANPRTRPVWNHSSPRLPADVEARLDALAKATGRTNETGYGMEGLSLTTALFRWSRLT